MNKTGSWMVAQLLAPKIHNTEAMAIIRKNSLLPEKVRRLGNTKPRSNGLTDRQREIALLASHGFNNLEIAEREGISDKTVHTHLKDISRITGFMRAEYWKIFISASALPDIQD